MAYFSKKIISAESWYKTHNTKLLTIIEVFKTGKYYIEGYKHKVLKLMDHNNLQYVIDTTSLGFMEVC